MKDLSNTHLIYVMNVPWTWLKQRPHFLALYLSIEIPVKIIYRANLFQPVEKAKDYPENIRRIIQLPLTRFSFISFINDIIFKMQMRSELTQASHILFQSPHDYQVLKNYLSADVKVIYDCMDDLIEFKYNSISGVERLKIEESAICRRSDFIFSSSNYLKNKIANRNNCKVYPEVLNNAVDVGFVESAFIQKTKTESTEFLDLYYVGTIAEWFDFNLIIDALTNFVNIRFILVGATVVKIPSHERLIFLGRIDHGKLSNLIKKANALIMPFKITELVKSVNPVKLYEYISLNVPIITCDYQEISIFENFVYRYKTNQDFFNLIDKLLNKELVVRSEHERRSFLMMNTWESRAKQMVNKILLND